MPSAAGAFVQQPRRVRLGEREIAAEAAQELRLLRIDPTVREHLIDRATVHGMHHLLVDIARIGVGQSEHLLQVGEVVALLRGERLILQAVLEEAPVEPAARRVELRREVDSVSCRELAHLIDRDVAHALRAREQILELAPRPAALPDQASDPAALVAGSKGTGMGSSQPIDRTTVPTLPARARRSRAALDRASL